MPPTIMHPPIPPFPPEIQPRLLSSMPQLSPSACIVPVLSRYDMIPSIPDSSNVIGYIDELDHIQYLVWLSTIE